jgi:hypothetical protein
MSSPEIRLPAPPPSTSSLLSKLGWSLAVALGLLAALLACRYYALASAVTLLTNDAELNRIEVQSLQQQLEAERIIAARQIADLTQATTESLVLVRLATPEPGNTNPCAIIVWQPSSQGGIFFAEQLPTPGLDEVYRLWIETDRRSPINAGEVKVTPTGPTHVVFHATQPLSEPTRFLLTRERVGGEPSSPGPVVMTGKP